MSASHDYLTVGQIAKRIGVGPKAVAKWVDSGLLPGFRIPRNGAPRPGDRRVHSEDFERFARQQKLPINGNGYGQHVLCLTDCASLRNRLETATGLGTCHICRSGFEAGYLFSECRPDIVVIDLGIGRGEGLAVAAYIRQVKLELRLYLLANEDEPDLPAICAIGTVFQKPFDCGLLMDALVIA